VGETATRLFAIAGIAPSAGRGAGEEPVISAGAEAFAGTGAGADTGAAGAGGATDAGGVAAAAGAGGGTELFEGSGVCPGADGTASAAWAFELGVVGVDRKSVV
jgi:hypothetical protein